MQRHLRQSLLARKPKNSLIPRTSRRSWSRTSGRSDDAARALAAYLGRSRFGYRATAVPERLGYRGPRPCQPCGAAVGSRAELVPIHYSSCDPGFALFKLRPRICRTGKKGVLAHSGGGTVSEDQGHVEVRRPPAPLPCPGRRRPCRQTGPNGNPKSVHASTLSQPAQPINPAVCGGAPGGEPVGLVGGDITPAEKIRFGRSGILVNFGDCHLWPTRW